MKIAPEPKNKFLNLFPEFTTSFQVHIVPHINLEERQQGSWDLEDLFIYGPSVQIARDIHDTIHLVL